MPARRRTIEETNIHLLSAGALIWALYCSSGNASKAAHNRWDQWKTMHPALCDQARDIGNRLYQAAPSA